MARKWIINDGDLILGNVEMHEDLLGSDRERKETVGGGRWHVDLIKDVIYFWGKSIDFGQVTEKQFEDAFKQPSVEKMEIVFSHGMDLVAILKEIEENCNKNE